MTTPTKEWYQIHGGREQYQDILTKTAACCATLREQDKRACENEHKMGVEIT